MRFLSSAILLAITQLAFAGDEIKPALDTAEGRTAFELLGKYYAENGARPNTQDVLARLKNPDASARKSAGQLLLGLLMQSMADERNGRAEWRQTPFWGGGSENAARNFRKELATEIGDKAEGVEALDAVRWLLDNERLAEAQAAGVQALRKIKGPGGDEFLIKLLAQQHPNAAVLKDSIDEAAARGLKNCSAEIQKLCTHYRAAVREAAIAAAKKLAIAPIPEYKPEDAFTPELDLQIRSMAARVWPPIPGTAEFKRFTRKNTDQPGRKSRRDPEGSAPFSAWVLKTDNDTLRVLDCFGRELNLTASNYEITPRTLADEAADLIKLRNGNDHDQREKLSVGGGLTGQFEPGFISVPEALVGAWSLVRGDRKTAAAVLFPRIDDAADDRWLDGATMDLLGHIYHQRMLDVFSHNRDYALTLELARHLSKDCFNGYQYQQRAKEMAAQLIKRSDDFKTFTLPEPAAWAEQKKNMSREDQIKFLASHLRLLNCVQMSQPGGVNYEDRQSSLPIYSRDQNSHEVINPYSELNAMKLAIADLPALVPFLGDENFMLTFSYWRDFHPSRTLHQVNWAVATIVDNTAKRELSDLKTYFSLDDEGKRQHLAKIMEWCKANAGKSREDLILQTMRESKDWKEFESVAQEAVAGKIAAALPVLLSRAGDFLKWKGEIAELCFHTHLPGALEAARGWAKEGFPAQDPNERRLDKLVEGHSSDSLRFWSGMILLEHGDRTKLEGLSLVRPLLEKDDDEIYWHSRAIDTLLNLKNEEASVLACGVLKNKRLDLHWDGAPLVHRLLLAGRDEAVRFVCGKLDSDSDARDSKGTWKGAEVTRKTTEGDRVAETVAHWRTDKYEYPEYAPDDERKKAREELKMWLKDQVALIKAGKKSELKPDAGNAPTAGWRLDAP